MFFAEPERKILLSEKGTDVQEVVADDNFLFIGTMNPGGDFGKKEVSNLKSLMHIDSVLCILFKKLIITLH